MIFMMAMMTIGHWSVVTVGNQEIQSAHTIEPANKSVHKKITGLFRSFSNFILWSFEGNVRVILRWFKWCQIRDEEDEDDEDEDDEDEEDDGGGEIYLVIEFILWKELLNG